MLKPASPLIFRPLNHGSLVSIERKRSGGNGPDLENVEGEEKGSTVEEIGAEAVDDGIFVTETGRKRGTSVATRRIVSIAALLGVMGGFFGIGYGISYGIGSAVRRSKMSPSTIGVEEQLPQVETSWPTYAPTAVEEAVVTPTPSPEPTPGPTPEPTEAIAEEEATEPVDLEGEDMPMPQIEEEEVATLDELFLCMSMHDKGVELSMDYGVEERENGGKSGKMKKSKKGDTMPTRPTPTRSPKSVKTKGKSSKTMPTMPYCTPNDINLRPFTGSCMDCCLCQDTHGSSQACSTNTGICECVTD